VRYLVLADIHANWEALQAVLEDARGDYDQVLNCGDLVGYGPDPELVTQWSLAHCRALVRGNHDKACAGQADLEWFNPVARACITWTRRQLSAASLSFISSLPPGPICAGQLELFHGAPWDEDEYLLEPDQLARAARELRHPLGLFGHTHLQGAWLFRAGRLSKIPHNIIPLDSDSVFLVNPGSVGQPRDMDPRAAYALLDWDGRTVELRRVAYDVQRTMGKLLSAGLPASLAARLRIGR
jgi:predicted phosphodiesterase